MPLLHEEKTRCRLGTALGMLLVATLASGGEAREASSPPVLPATGDLRLTYTVDGQDYPLRLFVPSAYHPSKAYAAVVALHGGGVDENSYFDRYERGRIKQVAEARQVLVLCPHRPGTTLREEAKHVGAALREIAGRYTLNPARLYLLGHSAGGSSALYQATLGSSPFAAVASIAGAAFFRDSERSPAGLNVPVFVGAATGDEIVPLALMLRTRDRLQAAGVPVTYHETPGSDHNAFVAPLFEEVFDWFLTHRRPLLPAKKTKNDASHN